MSLILNFGVAQIERRSLHFNSDAEYSTFFEYLLRNPSKTSAFYIKIKRQAQRDFFQS